MAIDVTFLEQGGQTPDQIAALLAEYIAAARSSLHIAVYDFRLSDAVAEPMGRRRVLVIQYGHLRRKKRPIKPIGHCESRQGRQHIPQGGQEIPLLTTAAYSGGQQGDALAYQVEDGFESLGQAQLSAGSIR